MTSALDVEYVYSQLYRQFTNSPHHLSKVFFLSSQVGSPHLKKVQQRTQLYPNNYFCQCLESLGTSLPEGFDTKL